ncbi:hypothetical protein K1719_018389 [Acacia pycnantha]|nr:hypothetical protein K1719_018389 [Acacia pycnantha]
MESNGFNLSIVPYNVVLVHGLCKSEHVGKAVDVERSLSKKGLKADVVTYCTLILGLCRVKDFEAGVKLMDEMIGSGFVPADAAVSGILEGLRKQGKIDTAYIVVIKKGDVAISYFDKMIESGIKVTVYPYNSLINGQCNHGNLSAAESLFMAMTNKGVSQAKDFIDSLHKKGLKLNELCYSALLQGYCQEGRLVESLSASEEMIQRGINMDMACYGVLVDASLEKQDMKNTI